MRSRPVNKPSREKVAGTRMTLSIRTSNNTIVDANALENIPKNYRSSTFENVSVMKLI